MDRTESLPIGASVTRYAPSRRDRRLVALAILVLLSAGLWLVFAVAGHEAGPPRALGGGGRMHVFDMPAADSAPRLRRALGRADGADVPSMPPEDAAGTEVAQGDPNSTDRVDSAGESGALSQAIAEVLADDPGAAGQRIDYRTRLVEHIRRFLFYPPDALDRGLSGTVVVRFRLDRTGQVIDLRITSTRGAVLDAAAMKTIWKAEPMPPVPPTIGTPWEVDVPIDFYASARRSG